jgi:hypothetical protein
VACSGEPLPTQWIFHTHPATRSTRIRPLIPATSGHPFHGHPATFRQEASQVFVSRNMHRFFGGAVPNGAIVHEIDSRGFTPQV